MSVGRQWVRRLGLLLAAGMVVQVPGLVGVGVSGASAANASYAATLSIGSNCVATVTATWNYAKPQALQFNVEDLTTGKMDGPVNEPVSGNSGTQTQSFQAQSFRLNPLLPGTGTLTAHSFNASVWFYNGSSSSLRYSNSVDAPCYLGQVV